MIETLLETEINMWVVFLFFLFSTTETVSEPTVLILARGGSKGIHLKNLQNVGGITLLARAITTAKSIGLDVTVSTDHPLIALESYKNGAAVFRRSKITATDWAPSIWGAAEFIASKPEVNILILIQATSPFIRAHYLRKALLRLNKYDCVFSVKRSFKLRWREVEVDGRVIALNFDPRARPRRQDWNGELLETGAFYITRRSLIEEGHFQNNK